MLDPAFASGIANSEFDGITSNDLMQVKSAVASERMISLDLVELCPNYDTGATAAAAARIIFKVIAQAENARLG